MGERRVGGVVSWDPGERARLVLGGRLVDEHARPLSVQGSGYRCSYSADPARIVADRMPRVLLGDTDEGPVTLVDAYLQLPATDLFDFGAALRQVWNPLMLVVGAHASEGNGALFDAVRFVLDGPERWRHLPERGAVSSEVGTVACERDGDELWLEFRPARRISLRSADRALRSMTTLAALALDVELVPVRLQVRDDSVGRWLDVKASHLASRANSWPETEGLLLSETLTLDRILRWLAIETVMDGLAAAVARPVENEAVQVGTLLACSLVEGIHRRIVDPAKSSYADRAKGLLEIASRVVPEIVEPVDDWPTLIKNVRNGLAHHDVGARFEARFHDWLIAESSIYWVLRVCLLSHAGFTDEQIAAALRENRRYGFYRENLKVLVRERAGVAAGR